MPGSPPRLDRCFSVATADGSGGMANNGPGSLNRGRCAGYESATTAGVWAAVFGAAADAARSDDPCVREAFWAVEQAILRRWTPEDARTPGTVLVRSCEPYE
jgi:hypothetical protein